VNDPQAAIETLARAPRALNLVVWRSRPDPDPQQEYAPSATGLTSPSLLTSPSAADEENSLVGAVPWAYYAHSVLPSGGAEGAAGPELPANVPLYEDLTVGERG